MSNKNLNESAEIAVYYGFSPIETPEIKKVDINNCKNLFYDDVVEDEGEETETVLPLHVEEKSSILRIYVEKKMDSLPQPVYLYIKGNFKNSLKKKNSSYSRYCDLEIVGDSKSISEAILIQTSIVILANEGYKDVCVEINSIGDKDSQARFLKELNQYYRKNANQIQPCCKEALKSDVFELLHCKNEKCHLLKMSAPKTIAYLGEASREHFKEVLEYLEALDIPYRINNNLIGNRKYCSDTIFEIIDMDSTSKVKKTLAVGVRYDGLSKRLGFKKEVGGVGISLLIKRKAKEIKRKIKTPTLYFIQLGFEAKCKSLQIIEMLRQAKIAVYHSLGKDKMTAQMNVLEKLKVTHTLLMGKKEAIEKTIIVKDMTKRSQETVPINKLVAYLKKRC
ncbi:MAG: His/Gly/Thr/Pro-type tRNA ligase C-terminal domain-containing protein [Patescibacteria group bacterium]|nr:His/Gly/Thr/Pro-type tRNA ligase C-terminal domain-containing protein [Patescibacteria group bacterium]